jgi:copper chaperone
MNELEKKRFKTTVKCSGCISNAKPFLDEVVGTNQWNIDLADPLKTLTVPANADGEKVVNAMARAGYKAEEV